MDTDTTVCQLIHVGCKSNEASEVLTVPTQTSAPIHQIEEHQWSRDRLIVARAIIKPTALCSKERYQSTDPCPVEHGQPQEQLLNPAKRGHFFAPSNQSVIARDFPALRYMTDCTYDCQFWITILRERTCFESGVIVTILKFLSHLVFAFNAPNV